MEGYLWAIVVAWFFWTLVCEIKFRLFVDELNQRLREIQDLCER